MCDCFLCHCEPNTINYLALDPLPSWQGGHNHQIQNAAFFQKYWSFYSFSWVKNISFWSFECKLELSTKEKKKRLMVVTKLNTNITLLRGNILYEVRCSLASGAAIWVKKNFSLLLSHYSRWNFHNFIRTFELLLSVDTNSYLLIGQVRANNSIKR